jgi:hypothetical protein
MSANWASPRFIHVLYSVFELTCQTEVEVADQACPEAAATWNEAPLACARGGADAVGGASLADHAGRVVRERGGPGAEAATARALAAVGAASGEGSPVPEVRRAGGAGPVAPGTGAAGLRASRGSGEEEEVRVRLGGGARTAGRACRRAGGPAAFRACAVAVGGAGAPCGPGAGRGGARGAAVAGVGAGAARPVASRPGSCTRALVQGVAACEVEAS